MFAAVGAAPQEDALTVSEIEDGMEAAGAPREAARSRRRGPCVAAALLASLTLAATLSLALVRRRSEQKQLDAEGTVSASDGIVAAMNANIQSVADEVTSPLESMKANIEAVTQPTGPTATGPTSAMDANVQHVATHGSSSSSMPHLSGGLSGLTVKEDTGCRNWHSITVGPSTIQDSSEACANRCRMTHGCLGINYQKNHCSHRASEQVARGSCYLLGEECDKGEIDCWDLLTLPEDQIMAFSDGFGSGTKATKFRTWCSNMDQITKVPAKKEWSLYSCKLKCQLDPTCSGIVYQTGSCTGPTAAGKDFCQLLHGECEETVVDKCWDIHYKALPALTTLFDDVPVGATSLPVASTEGFAIGDTIEISGGGSAEMNTVANLGSITLVEPTKFAYPSGATVTKQTNQANKSTMTPTYTTTTQTTVTTTFVSSTLTDTATTVRVTPSPTPEGQSQGELGAAVRDTQLDLITVKDWALMVGMRLTICGEATATVVLQATGPGSDQWWVHPDLPRGYPKGTLVVKEGHSCPAPVQPDPTPDVTTTENGTVAEGAGKGASEASGNMKVDGDFSVQVPIESATGASFDLAVEAFDKAIAASLDGVAASQVVSILSVPELDAVTELEEEEEEEENRRLETLTLKDENVEVKVKYTISSLSVQSAAAVVESLKRIRVEEIVDEIKLGLLDAGDATLAQTVEPLGDMNEPTVSEESNDGHSHPTFYVTQFAGKGEMNVFVNDESCFVLGDKIEFLSAMEDTGDTYTVINMGSLMLDKALKHDVAADTIVLRIWPDGDPTHCGPFVTTSTAA